MRKRSALLASSILCLTIVTSGLVSACSSKTAEQSWAEQSTQNQIAYDSWSSPGSTLTDSDRTAILKDCDINDSVLRQDHLNGRDMTADEIEREWHTYRWEQVATAINAHAAVNAELNTPLSDGAQ